MRWREGVLALGALGFALFLPFLQRVRAADAEDEAALPGAGAAIPLAGETRVGGARVETLVYRVEEGPEAHLRRLLARWRDAPAHLHVEETESGFFLGVVDVHAGLQWVHTIRGRSGGGAEVLRGVSRLGGAREGAHPRLLDAIGLPEASLLLSHVQDRVGEREVETSVLVSEVDADSLVARLQRDLPISPCGSEPRGGRRAGAIRSLCGQRGEVEIRLTVEPREEGETWMLLRLSKGEP